MKISAIESTFLEGFISNPGRFVDVTPFATKGDFLNFVIQIEKIPQQGWGLYAEYLGEEMCIYRDDFEIMGRYSNEIYRACRLVIDTGLHYFGWDRDRAIEYLIHYTGMTREAAVIEIDHYITCPEQACGYKIGELKIKEKRQKASKELGYFENFIFDLPKFHYISLSNGHMPLRVLENLIDN